MSEDEKNRDQNNPESDNTQDNPEQKAELPPVPAQAPPSLGIGQPIGEAVTPPVPDAAPPGTGDGYPPDTLPEVQEISAQDLSAVLQKYGLADLKDTAWLPLKELLQETKLTRDMVCHLAFYCGLRERHRPLDPDFATAFFKVEDVKKAISKCKLLPDNTLPEAKPYLLQDVADAVKILYPTFHGKFKNTKHYAASLHIPGRSSRRSSTVAIDFQAAQDLIRMQALDPDQDLQIAPFEEPSVPTKKASSKKKTPSKEVDLPEQQVEVPPVLSDDHFKWAEDFPWEWFQRVQELRGDSVLKVALYLWKEAAKSPSHVVATRAADFGTALSLHLSTVTGVFRKLRGAKLIENGKGRNRRTIIRILDVPSEPPSQPEQEEVTENEPSSAPPSVSPGKFVDIETIAQHFSTTVKKVQKWVDQGSIPVHYLGPDRLQRFRLDEVEAALTED